MRQVIASFILLLSLILLFNATTITRIKKSSRTVSPETVMFQFIYLGTCNKFNSLIPNIQISSKINGSTCLPINSTSPYADIGDLSAHILCTDIGQNRAQIDFVEIYLIYDLPLVNGPDSFIISFASNAPYKATSSGVVYLRKPTCDIDQDYCSTTDYVKSCSENIVTLQNGFVINKDTVYIIPDGSNYVGCSSSENTCCAYISPGFCPRNADNGLFKIKFNQNNNNNHGHRPPHHEEHHHEEHRPHHEEHHHDDGDHDEDDRPPHHEEHHHEEHRPHHEEHHHDDGDNDEDDREDRHHEDGKKKKKQEISEKVAPALSLEPPKVLPLLELRFPGESDEENDHQNEPVLEKPFTFNLQKPVTPSAAPVAPVAPVTNNKPSGHKSHSNKLVAGKSKHKSGNKLVAGKHSVTN